jgi:hypothetical protein
MKMSRKAIFKMEADSKGMIGSKKKGKKLDKYSKGPRKMK